MTIRENVDKEVLDALDVETRELFPKIYNGFTETDALAQAEDALRKVISNVIYKYFQNRNLQTLNEEVVAAFEEGLGLPSAGNLDARRTAVISRINARFINNDQTIESRAREAANNNTIKVNADSQALTAEVTTATNSSTATFDELITALKAIRGLIPQNLEAYAADRSAKAKPWQAYGAARTTVSINAGRVEEPPRIAESVAYFTTAGESATTDRTIGYTAWYGLYDAEGKTILLKPECEYTLLKFIAADGYEYNPNESTFFYPQFHFGYTSNSEYILYLYLKVNVSRGFRQVVYRETPATLYTGYLTADKTPGVAGPWSIAIIYDENGVQVPYGSSYPQIAVAYYYVNGERIYNGDAKVRVTDYGGSLAIGAQTDITIEKIEYSIQPGVYS